MSVFVYLSGFKTFTPLVRWRDFAKFLSGKNKQSVAVRHEVLLNSKINHIYLHFALVRGLLLNNTKFLPQY